jgi:hypothetical protein
VVTFSHENNERFVGFVVLVAAHKLLGFSPLANYTERPPLVGEASDN